MLDVVTSNSIGVKVIITESVVFFVCKTTKGGVRLVTNVVDCHGSLEQKSREHLSGDRVYFGKKSGYSCIAALQVMATERGREVPVIALSEKTRLGLSSNLAD